MTTHTEYHRPDSLEEALALLGRASPVTRPLAGGTRLSAGSRPPAALVDLAALPLAEIARPG
ncbi:MAG: FAD binding domain-containing protein [Anaerolineae bacterium]|nr:FAD binding domain-containing protein [Anaerolineae bacterium]